MSKGTKSFLTAIAEAKAAKEAKAQQAASVEKTAVAAHTVQQEVQAKQSTAERLAKMRAKLGLSTPLGITNIPTQPQEPPEPAEQSLADLPDSAVLVLTPEEQALDADIAALGIIEAYNMWCGKVFVQPTTKRDGIMVSCPNPQHPDKNPSAWLNQDKNTWFCPGCAEGGDIWDIAAWNYNYQVPGYKQDKQKFRELREQIAGALGYKKYTTSAGTLLSRTPPVVAQEEIPDAHGVHGTADHAQEPTAEGTVSASGVADHPSNVVQLRLVEDDEEYAAAVGEQVPSIDWKQLVSEGSFLEAWMLETTKDTCPEEYHFFTGLMALGFAVGRHRVLLDNPTVSSNLFVCLTGPSGTGKSRARNHLKAVLAEALPFKQSDPMPTGTRLAGSPSSGESLVDMFGHKIEDPSTPKEQWQDWPVRAYVEFDEMASLISKGTRAGSSLKPTLMEVYDAPRSVSITSRTFGTSSASRPYGQVMTTTQNKSIREVVNTKDDAAGFINRWVFVTGPRKKQKAINTHVTDYTNPAAKLKGVHSWALNPKNISFTDDALALFEDFYENVFEMKDRAEEESAIFNRIDLLLKKIVLLFAINDRSDVIQTVHVERTMALYPYFIQAYGVVQVELAHSEDRDTEQKIYGAIQRYYDRNSKAITVGAVARYIKGIDTKDMVRIIENMVKIGYLIEEETPAGRRGRPSKMLLPGARVPGVAA